MIVAEVIFILEYLQDILMAGRLATAMASTSYYGSRYYSPFYTRPYYGYGWGGYYDPFF